MTRDVFSPLFVKKRYIDTKNVTFKLTIWNHKLASNIKKVKGSARLISNYLII